jgi:hypothetical protein
MPTEVTASVMIGTIAANSYHGQPSSTPTGRLFCPSHELELKEGSRATWEMQRRPFMGRPAPAFRIQPSSPEYLLAAAVLGFVAFTQPEVVNASDRLRAVVAPIASSRELRVLPVDRDLASDIFAFCSDYAYGVVTVLPGSTITDDERRIAAASGVRVAVAGRAVAGSAMA